MAKLDNNLSQVMSRLRFLLPCAVLSRYFLANYTQRQKASNQSPFS